MVYEVNLRHFMGFSLCPISNVGGKTVSLLLIFSLVRFTGPFWRSDQFGTTDFTLFFSIRNLECDLRNLDPKEYLDDNRNLGML